MLKHIDNESAGARLRKLRKKAKMDQSDVGARIGVHQTTVSAWEKGKVAIEQNHVEALATLFKVSEDVFAESPVVAQSEYPDFQRNPPLRTEIDPPDLFHAVGIILAAPFGRSIILGLATLASKDKAKLGPVAALIRSFGVIGQSAVTNNESLPGQKGDQG